MNVEKTKINDIDVFTLNGRLDASGSEKAHDSVIPDIPKDGKLILDMTNCNYVASSGLRVLLITAKQSAVLNCKTVITGMAETVIEVMEMTGFNSILESYQSIDDAAAALS